MGTDPRRRRFLLSAGMVATTGVAGCGELLGEEPSGGGQTGKVVSIDAPTTIDEPGTYELTADITSERTAIVVTASDVTLEGRGQTIAKASSRPDEYGVHITGDNVTVRSVTVEGWGQMGAGILCESVENGAIGGVTARDNDFGIVLAETSETRVSNNEIVRNTESGINLRNAADNHLTENTLTNNELRNNLGAIHLEGAQTTGNEIADNQLHDNGDTAIILIEADENSLRSNSLTGNGRHGIFLEGASANEVSKNEATGNGITGIDLAFDAHDNTIADNHLADNDGHGVWVLESARNVIESNTIDSNQQIGVILADATENEIRSNSVTGNRLGGVQLFGEDHYTELTGANANDVVENEVVDNEGREGYAVGIHDSHDNVLRGNTIAGTPADGIQLLNATGTEVSENAIRDNEGRGLALKTMVDDLSVEANVLADNGRGVEVAIDSTGDVTITGNDIHDNAEYGVLVWDARAGQIPENTPDLPVVSATGNWWGASSGPRHPEANPDGAGNRVSDVVEFDPWEEEPLVEN